MAMVVLWAALGCRLSADQLQEVREEAGEPDEGEDGGGAGSDDCPSFTFLWRAPISGYMVMSGEFQTPDGTVSVPWDDWSDAEGSSISYTWDGLCEEFSFRGSASLDIDGSGASSFTCVTQDDDSFAVVGEVEFWLDSEPLSVQTRADPKSDGCGVFAEARW